MSSTLYPSVLVVNTPSHPLHALCRDVLYNWTRYSGVLLLTLQLAGTSAGCAGTALPANINTARTSKAGQPGQRHLSMLIAMHRSIT